MPRCRVALDSCGLMARIIYLLGLDGRESSWSVCPCNLYSLTCNIRSEMDMTDPRGGAAWPRSSHRPLRAELTGDEGFDHVNSPIRLRAWLNNPAVLGTREDLVVDLAARCPVRRHEVLLHRGEHVVIQFAL